jgi:hypothetical protein
MPRSATLWSSKRWLGPLLALLVVNGCGGPSPTQRGPATPRPQLTGPALRQCLADLDRLGARYRRLPDQNFPGGCQQIGTVQLVDIGVPVTNLGPVTCPLARAMTGWVRDAVQPAARVWMSSKVTKVETMGSYSCRPVNGVAGNKLSEHGMANAVDISGFDFANGRRVTVLAAWNGEDPDGRDFIRAAFGSGCRHFTKILGPQANSLHANHFHLDMGQGDYCR